MEILDEIMKAISTTGFPIVMCIVMFNYMKDISNTHNDEIKNIIASINELTLKIQQLVDKM